MFYKPPRKIENFCVGIADIIDGIVKVLTLGFFGSTLSYKVIFWFHKG